MTITTILAIAIALGILLELNGIRREMRRHRPECPDCEHYQNQALLHEHEVIHTEARLDAHLRNGERSAS